VVQKESLKILNFELVSEFIFGIFFELEEVFVSIRFFVKVLFVFGKITYVNKVSSTKKLLNKITKKT
jgi:hypothetical protein